METAASTTEAPLPRTKPPLTISPVVKKRDLARFIRLPWSLYQNDPAWVPPLLLERRQLLSASNPYFEHAECRLWIARRGDTPVGRISAQIDRLHLERYRDQTGFFGMIEAQDDPEVFQSLFLTAENWLRQKGMRRIRGPFNLSINQEAGLLVDGFDFPPVVMMGHALPYYASRLAALGYAQEMDLLAYLIDINFKATPSMSRIAARASKRVHVRSIRKSRFSEDARTLQEIFNDAWSGNWGFLPFTDSEFTHLARDLKFLIPLDFAQIAEVDGEPAAMIVGLPDVNLAIRDLNGRLLPFGWLKLLWRLKFGFPATARVPLMGVRRKFQDSLLGAALAFLVIDNVRQSGRKLKVQQVELSWILESNKGMRNIIEALGGKAYKRYRIFGKSLI